MSKGFEPDLTESVRASESLDVLLDASALLVASTARADLPSSVLDLAAKLIEADAYAIWRTSQEGSVWRIVASRGLSPGYRSEVPATPGSVTMPVVEDIENEPSLAWSREAYLAEGIRSLMVVPLLLSQEVDGTIAFYWRRKRVFAQAEKNAARALANLASAALRLHELHEQNVRERRRLSFLAEASAVLASSLDYETTLERVARLAVPQIADWCTVHVLEDGKLNRLVVAHADPAMLIQAQEYSRRFPEELHPDHGLGAVLRTGETQYVARVTDEMIAAAIDDPEQLHAVRALGLTSSILVALVSQGKVLGAIRMLAADADRHFTPQDVELAEDLARRAAAAIENAQLHRASLQQQSQLRLSHAVARMGSWSWDLVKDTLTWSDEFKILHGLPLDAEPSHDAGANLVYPEDRELVLRELSATLASDAQQLRYEHRALSADGRLLWVQSHGRIERDADGKAIRIFGITIDVTESRLAEQALRRSEKLVAAGRMAATVAHEINNPLEALTNLVFLARRVEGVPAEASEYLGKAETEISQMAHVVRQTLGFYRESLHPQPTDMGHLLTEVLNLYARRIESKGLTVQSSAPHGLMATVNGGEIRQVLSNLIANAIDATRPPGGLRIAAERAGDSICFAIADDGCGVTEANQTHLFEPFFTTKPDVGTGLGLWVSKGIVEKHGGRITVESRTGETSHGTVFRIEIPAGHLTASHLV